MASSVPSDSVRSFPETKPPGQLEMVGTLTEGPQVESQLQRIVPDLRFHSKSLAVSSVENCSSPIVEEDGTSIQDIKIIASEPTYHTPASPQTRDNKAVSSQNSDPTLITITMILQSPRIVTQFVKTTHQVIREEQWVAHLVRLHLQEAWNAGAVTMEQIIQAFHDCPSVILLIGDKDPGKKLAYHQLNHIQDLTYTCAKLNINDGDTLYIHIVPQSTLPSDSSMRCDKCFNMEQEQEVSKGSKEDPEELEAIKVADIQHQHQ